MYCTPTDLKTYLGIADSGDDALLGALLAAAQAAIDAQTGRVFEATADAARTFDAVRDVAGRTLYFDADCAAITSVVNGDGATVAANQYVTEPRNGGPWYAITLLGSGGAGWVSGADAENAITVTGRWAYSQSAPSDIAQAAKRLAAFMYRQRDNLGEGDRTVIASGATLLPVSLPSDVKALLAPYKRLR